MLSYHAYWNKWKSRADRIVPASRQVLGWLLLALVALATGSVFPTFSWSGFVFFGGFLVVVLLDYRAVKKILIWDIQRVFSARPQLGQPLGITIIVTVSNNSKSTATSLRNLEFQLGEPANMRLVTPVKQVPLAEGMVANPDMYTSTQPNQQADSNQQHGSNQQLFFESVLIPMRRGRVSFAPVDARYSSPFGMWLAMHRSGQVSTEALVLPDVTSWRESALTLTQTLFQEGRHVKRFASGDTDFAYISEYGMDDDLRSVNWAATARRARLMKNVYQPERGQHIIIAVDASRYMAVELPDGQTRLDHAVTSALALAHTAMQLGDSVGVIGFSSQVNLRILPDKGSRHFKTIVEGLAALTAKSEQGGYQALFANLAGHFRRRSLLIVFSELDGLATDAAFLPAIQAARRHHPTLFVSLAPVHLHELFDKPPSTEADSATLAATEWLLEEREDLQGILQRGGVELVEAPPSHLVTRVVSGYLRRKQRGSL